MKLICEYRENLFIIRDLLKKANYIEESKCIDKVASQYDGLSIRDKINMLKKLSIVFHTRALGDVYVEELSYAEWNSKLSEAKMQTEQALYLAECDIGVVQFPNEFMYDNKKMEFYNNVIDYEMFESLYLLLMKGVNNTYFEDNLACFDAFGRIVWWSGDIIDVRNRRGACFTYIRKIDNRLLEAFAWVGIKYIIDVKAGKVVDRLITK